MQHQELGLITPTEPTFNIAAAIARALITPGAAVWIPAWYVGGDSVPNSPGVPVFDMRGTTGSFTGSGGGGAFSALTGGTNTTAAMVIGTGASLSTSGTGTIVATSVTAAGQAGGGTVVDASQSPYNVVPGFFISDATFTNGQNTISCAFSNDCNFTASMNGWICYGTNQTSDVSGITSIVILPQGTLTVTGAQTATCSGGNATQTTTHNGTFVTGPDSSTTLASAWTATIAICGTLLLPAGAIIVQSAQFNTTNTRCTNSSTGYPLYSITGYGATISNIMPTPNFNAASCTGGSGGTCFFGATGLNLQNFGIYGAGQSAIGAGFNGKVGAEMYGGGVGNDAYWTNVNLFSWGANTAGFTGFQANSLSGGTLVNMRNDGMGIVSCNISSTSSPQVIMMYGCYCANSNAQSLVLAGANAVVKSFGGIYGSIGASGTLGAIYNNGGELWSIGDDIPYTVVGASIRADGASLTHIIGSRLINLNTTVGSALTLASTAQVWVRDSILSSTGGTGNYGAFISSGTKLWSLGGNTFAGGTGAGAAINLAAGGFFVPDATDTYSVGTVSSTIPTCAMTTGGGTGPACALIAGSNNLAGTIRLTPGTAPGTTGTVTLTFAGSLTGPNGTTPSCSIDLAGTGTGAWNGVSANALLTTRSSSAPIFTWNNTVALTAASTYDMDYICVPR